MIAALGSMQVGQIAATVAGCQQLPANSRLPFHKYDLDILIFRSRQSSRHTGCTGTNNTNDHKYLFKF